MLSFRNVVTSLLLLLFMSLSVMPAGSDVIVPFEWIVAGAYARYKGIGTCDLFYPNCTGVLFWTSGFYSFLEWTVLSRTGDSVQLNVTFYVEGNAKVYYMESVPDGKVNILDIAAVAKAFGKKVYEWGYDYNADVTGDQKVDILDISFLAKAYGSSPDDPRWNGKADIAPEEKREVDRPGFIHRKTLLLEIDIYSRDTFLDGKPLGKTCFWAEPYAEINDTFVLYGLSPDELVGTVRSVNEEWGGWYGWPGITTAGVEVLQLPPAPFAWFYTRFDWHTGMAMEVYLLGDQPLNPDAKCTAGFNGTEYTITEFASTPLGTEFNVGYSACEVTLNSTSVQIGPPP